MSIATLFESDSMCLSLDHITRVEKKRDGALTAHFAGSDFVMIPKNDCPGFLDAYRNYHLALSAGQVKISAAATP